MQWPKYSVIRNCLAEKATQGLGVSLLNQAEEDVVADMLGDWAALYGKHPRFIHRVGLSPKYFFTVRDSAGDAWIVPGLDETLSNQPYHLVRQQATDA